MYPRGSPVQLSRAAGIVVQKRFPVLLPPRDSRVVNDHRINAGVTKRRGNYAISLSACMSYTDLLHMCKASHATSLGISHALVLSCHSYEFPENIPCIFWQTLFFHTGVMCLLLVGCVVCLDSLGCFDCFEGCCSCLADLLVATMCGHLPPPSASSGSCSTEVCHNNILPIRNAK